MDARIKSGHDEWGCVHINLYFKQQSFADTVSRSRRMLFSRGVHLFPALKSEGAGNAGRPMRPRSRVQDVIESAHEHTGHTGITRHSPRNGFTDYTVLSPVLGLFGH